jgi:hypothetical protein
VKALFHAQNSRVVALLWGKGCHHDLLVVRGNARVLVLPQAGGTWHEETHSEIKRSVNGVALRETKVSLAKVEEER